MHSVEKWSNILLKSCGVNEARFLKYVSPFFQLYQGVIGYRFWAHENLLPNLELAKNKISIKLEMINYLN